MSEHEALARAAYFNNLSGPAIEDEMISLVYADWLGDHDATGAAEIIRWHVAHTRSGISVWEVPVDNDQPHPPPWTGRTDVSSSGSTYTVRYLIRVPEDRYGYAGWRMTGLSAAEAIDLLSRMPGVYRAEHWAGVLAGNNSTESDGADVRAETRRIDTVMNTWKQYLAARIDRLVEDDNLDPNDPVTKAIMNDPDLIAAFQKNPGKAAVSRQKAQQIVGVARQKQKDPVVVAKAQNIASKGGMT